MFSLTAAGDQEETSIAWEQEKEHIMPVMVSYVAIQALGGLEEDSIGDQDSLVLFTNDPLIPVSSPP